MCRKHHQLPAFTPTGTTFSTPCGQWEPQTGKPLVAHGRASPSTRKILDNPFPVVRFDDLRSSTDPGWIYPAATTRGAIHQPSRRTSRSIDILWISQKVVVIFSLRVRISRPISVQSELLSYPHLSVTLFFGPRLFVIAFPCHLTTLPTAIPDRAQRPSSKRLHSLELCLTPSADSPARRYNKPSMPFANLYETSVVQA